MVLRVLFISLLFSSFLVLNVIANFNYERITLYGHSNSPPGERGPLLFDADFEEAESALTSNSRRKRDVPLQKDNITKVIHLKDRHKQLMVHWVGEGSEVIICLARDPVSSISPQAIVNPSAVYISYDYGESFENKTEFFKLENGSYSTVEKFYNHPNYNTYFVFTDVRNKQIFVTTDLGKTITRISVDFTPSEVQFKEQYAKNIFILDKANPERKLYHSTDFGNSFSVFEEYVKTFTWINNKQDLVLQRMLPSNLSSILYTKSAPLTRYMLWLAKDVVDMFVKGDYLFYTQKSNNDDYDLFVSHKLKQAKKCIFDTDLKRQAYQIVDITNDRALVSISHSDTSSHLYVSENLGVRGDFVRFVLSLEYVLAYFPNTSWPDSWLHHVAEEPFTDIYKVEGLTGIYIASQVAYVPPPRNLGPQHLVTKITFDHGASWSYVKSPERDNEEQLISCDLINNCSLHLSQRFSQLYPDTRTISILSSKSAPGILIATGVIGISLKGHFGVYISTDAGLTWKQALKDLYFFNMGDHGSVLTAVKYYKTRGETRDILYSTNEGETWNNISFHEEEIRLYGLMTEPGENTTIFTMFGSLPEEHQWIIVKIDMRSVLERKCVESDYKDWVPSFVVNGKSTIPCTMGQQSVYKRKMAKVTCYNDENYDFPISVQSCECTSVDYECDFGFIKDETLGHCIRNKSSKYDPYAIPESCSAGKFYNRTKGYRKISGNNCIKDYANSYEPDSIPCPFKEISTFMLIAQRDKIIRLDPFTKETTMLPITDFKNVIAIDFDMKNNCVFWADIIKDHIGRQCLNGSTSNEILVNSNLSSVEGMAYDWISKNLYFVDGKNAKIELVRTDISHNRHYFRKTILSSPVLKKPRGIAVHPTSEYLFWTDWADNPSISRSNLDGSDYKTLFSKPKIQWPNGITIDHIAERIYWVDAKEDYIGSSDLNGDKFKKVLTNTDYLSHPFSIAVFKDVMYWDDWKKNAIFSADKDHGIEITTLAEKTPGLMEMKIFAHSIQSGTNACSNSTCEYICVSVKGVANCLCPDVLELLNGKCLCPGGIQPSLNMQCPQYQSTCSSKYFSCNNGQCIPKSWQCDKDIDCSNGEDELNCDPSTCPPLHFACDDGSCLPEHLKCDYDLDCKDGSDEKHCPVQNCTKDQFTCKNGRCISKKWLCDSDNDCRDWSDEQNCYPSEPVDCQPNEFKCQTGGMKCIPQSWVCDRHYDCSDRTDELNCTNITCSDSQFQCGGPDKKCINKEWLCDGDSDCDDSSDEVNCTAPFPTVRPHFIVPNTSCHDWMFTCTSKKCIPHWWKCDRARDCEDGSDEIGCNYPTTPETTSTETPWREFHVCGSYTFQCLSGECIDASWVCDGSADCPDGDDELHCSKILHCNKDQFKCRKDGSCINIDFVCNGKIDCPDGSDEVSCTHDHNLPEIPATASCANGFFPCDVITCYPMAMLCDGKPNCNDGFDEKNCSTSSRYYQVLQMGIDDRTKNESSMLLYWWLPVPDTDKLEFLPSISEIRNGTWENKTWTQQPDYQFTGLKPYTKYNMTVYVRINGTKKVFVPAKYYTDITGEGTPSAPTNVSVTQQNGSHILVSWGKPEQPNGIIQYYELCWFPPSPPIKLNLSDNTTAHLLGNDFQPNITYNFYVVAYNGKYASGMSEVKKLLFDGDVQIDIIRNLSVVNQSESNVTLSWIYMKPSDGFLIDVEARDPFPILPQRNMTTRNNNQSYKYTITDLAPDVFYTFKVRSYKKQFQGPESSISASTSGHSFPELMKLQLMVHKETGTAVKLSWDISKDIRKVQWVYGIYYGLTEADALMNSRYNTTNLTATISNLGACENYIFGVGIVGPLGIGPVALRSTAKTYFNKRAPPKNLNAKIAHDGSTNMIVQWDASCPLIADPIGYVLTVKEKVKNLTKTLTFLNVKETEVTKRFSISQGGIYEITVSTDVIDAIPSEPFIFSPPAIPPPLEVQAVSESNGSYFIYWREHKRPSVSVNYTFEVLVSEGNSVNDSTAQIFEAIKPPFIYTNTTADVYSFAVRLKTEYNYTSVLSETFTITNPIKSAWSDNISKTSLTTVLVIVCMLLIILGGAFGFLYMRHRRLQNSFTRFANSHYDTRADAATFEDNGLEEDEAPQIRGFSDDEPLVIA